MMSPPDTPLHEHRRVDSMTAAILAVAGSARRGALAMGTPARDLDDVVQDALVAVWRRARSGGLRDLSDRAALSAYMHAAAKNAALHHARRRRRLALLDDLPEPSTDPLGHLEARSALRALPAPTYLRRIYAALAAGETLATYARAAGITHGAAYGRIRRARAALRDERPRRLAS